MSKYLRQLLVVVGGLLIAAGLGVALYNLWPDITFSLGMVEQRYPYHTVLLDEAETSGTPTANGARERPLAATPESDTPPTGRRVVIPALGVDAAVYDGDSADALARGVYVYADSALPGDEGNVVVAGHRTARQFALLHRLEPGDLVILYWDGAEHDYVVERIFEVLPDQTDVLDVGTEELLTLYTCVPRFLGNRRTVVVARPL